jgi:hypothetical protein
MPRLTRAIAALDLVLIFPAVLFMIALVIRTLPLQYEPAHAAQRVVMWYSGKVWTLWMLLLVLPLAVLVTGSATLLRGWNRDVEKPDATRQSLAVVTLTTMAAAGILVVVVLHMLAN